MKTVVERDRGARVANLAWKLHSRPRRPGRPKAAVVELAAWSAAVLSEDSWLEWQSSHPHPPTPEAP